MAPRSNKVLLYAVHEMMNRLTQTISPTFPNRSFWNAKEFSISSLMRSLI